MAGGKTLQILTQQARKRHMKDTPLTRTEAGPDPVALFSRWLEQAEEAQAPLPNAMALSTVDEQGRPRSRMVLLKGIENEEFVFYTNYGSAKARELAACSHAALTFWWSGLNRQVRVEGAVRKVSHETSKAYFATRPRESQLGAYASHQSEEVADRETMLRQYAQVEQRFAGCEVPCPEFWGGLALAPECIEFWQNAPGRMHDRICYRRASSGAWHQSRLSP